MSCSPATYRQSVEGTTKEMGPFRYFDWCLFCPCPQFITDLTQQSGGFSFSAQLLWNVNYWELWLQIIENMYSARVWGSDTDVLHTFHGSHRTVASHAHKKYLLSIPTSYHDLSVRDGGLNTEATCTRKQSAENGIVFSFLFKKSPHSDDKVLITIAAHTDLQKWLQTL